MEKSSMGYGVSMIGGDVYKGSSISIGNDPFADI